MSDALTAFTQQRLNNQKTLQGRFTMTESFEKEKTNDLGLVESQRQGEMAQPNELRRDFKPHQVFMFSIACAIGTGLVIGTGSALSRGGPGSLLIAYILIGITVFFVMTAIGEMATFLPMNKGFGGYATRMVDPALGYDDFSCGNFRTDMV